MIALLKAICLVIYGLALAGLVLPLPWGLAALSQALAALFLAVHVLEALVCHKLLRQHPGGLWAGVWRTLLFGVLHLGPLARRRAVAAAGSKLW